MDWLVDGVLWHQPEPVVRGGGNAVSLVISAQVLNGFITPVLLTYILILANRRPVLGDAANGPIFRAVATPCATVLGLLPAVVLVQTVAGWL